MASPKVASEISKETSETGFFDFLSLDLGVKDEASDLGAEILGSAIGKGKENLPSSDLDRTNIAKASSVERNRVKDNVVDWFLVDAKSDSERTTLKKDINLSQKKLQPALAAANDNFKDEKKLKSGLDQLENFENKVKEDRAKEGLSLDEESVATQLDSELDRFAPDDEKSHRRKLKSRSDVIYDNWKNYLAKGGGFRNLWSLLKVSTVDMFAYGAVARTVPVWNSGVELNKRAKSIKDSADPYVESTKKGARKTKKTLRAKREAEIEGTGAVLKMKDWSSKFSSSMKSVVFDVARGKRGKEEVYQQAVSHLEGFKKSSPEAFDLYLRKNKVNYLDFNKRETVSGLIFRTCDWYLKPKYRTSDSLKEDLAEALPIYGTYAAIRDINDENGLPIWMRYGFIGFNLGLDALTIGSLGAFTPVATAARMAVGFGAKAGARATVKSGATFSAKNLAGKVGAKATEFSSKEFLATLPRKTRKALLSTTSAKLLTGYAAYSGLSHTLDYVLGGYFNEALIEEVAETSVEKALDREFTKEQKRLIRITSRTAVDLAKKAANDNDIEAGVKAEDQRKKDKESELLAA